MVALSNLKSLIIYPSIEQSEEYLSLLFFTKILPTLFLFGKRSLRQAEEYVIDIEREEYLSLLTDTAR